MSGTLCLSPIMVLGVIRDVSKAVTRCTVVVFLDATINPKVITSTGG